MIRNLDHNLDYTVDYCRYTVPSHFDGRWRRRQRQRLDDDLNMMDGSADGSCPNMDHSAVVDTRTISVNSVVLLAFDRSSNQRLLGISAVYANCQTDRHDRWLNLRIAVNQQNG